MGLRPHQRARVRFLLRRGTAEALDEAHDLSRNDPDLHARVHLARARVAAKERRLGLLRAELTQTAMAPLASTLRRLGGYRPEDPNEGGLLETWRSRPGRGRSDRRRH